MEQPPKNNDELYALASMTEAAFVSEDWQSLSGPDMPHPSAMTSIKLCARLQREFEWKHHLINNRLVQLSQEWPDDTQPLWLTDPYLFIPQLNSNNLNGPYEKFERFEISGDIPVFYYGIKLYASITRDNRVYKGPHFIGLFDARLFVENNIHHLPSEGLINFVTPFKDTVVSDKYRPTLYN